MKKGNLLIIVAIISLLCDAKEMRCIKAEFNSMDDFDISLFYNTIDYSNALICYEKYNEIEKNYMNNAELYPTDDITMVYNYACKLYDKKEYDKCIPIFLALTKKGHKESFRYLATCYEHGWGVSSNSKQAMKYYDAAFKGKDPLGSYWYGLYLNKIGNFKRAKDCFSFLAECEDFKKNYYYDNAVLLLAINYDKGLAGIPDKELATKYYRIVAKGQHSFECLNEAKNALKRMGVSLYAISDFKDPTPQMISGNSSLGLYKKGKDYYDGFHVDKGMAYSYFKAAAQGNHPDAFYYLGCLYGDKELPIYSESTSIDYYLKAIEYYRIEAEKGDIDRITKIGNMYREGLGLRIDKKEAKKWYLKGAEKGNNECRFWLGKILEEEGAYKDALYWLETAGRNGHSTAAYLAANIYEEGRLGNENNKLAPNIKKAIEMYTLVKNTSKYRKQATERLKEIDEMDLGEVIRFKHSESLLNSQQTEIISESTEKVIDSIDINIPSLGCKNRNTFAIIIANEDYKHEPTVEYAKNDGEVFKMYCQKILGLTEKNVHYIPNATLNNIIGELDWLKQVSEAFNGDVKIIFYYAGHGIPDETSAKRYLLPVDGDSRRIATCLGINELYEILGTLPAKRITILMDACFSGANRDGGMLVSARGVAIKSKAGIPKGNMIVLSAAQSDETAHNHNEAKHGLFTYFLLKKLKDSHGKITLGELSEYITENVKQYSVVEVGKIQTPNVKTSETLSAKWKTLFFNECD